MEALIKNTGLSVRIFLPRRVAYAEGYLAFTFGLSGSESLFPSRLDVKDIAAIFIEQRQREGDTWPRTSSSKRAASAL